MSEQMFDVDECHLWVPDTMTEPSFPVTKEEIEDTIRYCTKELINDSKKNYSFVEVGDIGVLVIRNEPCSCDKSGKSYYDVKVMKLIQTGYTDDRVEIENVGE